MLPYTREQLISKLASLVDAIHPLFQSYNGSDSVIERLAWHVAMSIRVFVIAFATLTPAVIIFLGFVIGQMLKGR